MSLEQAEAVLEFDPAMTDVEHLRKAIEDGKLKGSESLPVAMNYKFKESLHLFSMHQKQLSQRVLLQ